MVTKGVSVAERHGVVSPIGQPTVEQITQTPRLDNLAGKTICSVINNSFMSWLTAPLCERLLAEKYPTARVIPSAEMPRASKAPAPGTTDKNTDALIAALKERRCDALIVGNGG